MGLEMLRGVDTERSECAQHDRAVTHTASWMNWLNFIIMPLQASLVNTLYAKDKP